MDAGLDLDRWAALAKKASQGRWHLDPQYRGWIFADGSYIATTHRGRDALVLPNAEFIAYSSPEHVLELIARNRFNVGALSMLQGPIA